MDVVQFLTVIMLAGAGACGWLVVFRPGNPIAASFRFIKFGAGGEAEMPAVRLFAYADILSSLLDLHALRPPQPDQAFDSSAARDARTDSSCRLTIRTYNRPIGV